MGWRILIEPVEVKKQTEGGILLAPESVRAQEYLRYIGKVVGVGELAFLDAKFRPHPNAAAKPWCKVGDCVVVGKHAGQEVFATVDGQQKTYRLLNDDEVLAVADDPAAIVTPM